MEIKINYTEVISRTRALRRKLETSLRETDRSYVSISHGLSRMDSRTNAAIEETIEANRMKGEVCVETLQRVLAAMESAALIAEQQERELARIFHKGGTR